MCLLAVFFRVVDDATVIAGANREELYERGGSPPRLLHGTSNSVAGVDPVAGGTWFGVNANGVLVAVTNRRKLDVPVSPRSRGLLARDLLTCSTAAAAVDRAITALERDSYAGSNFLCADASRTIVIQAGEWLRIRPLPPGIHVLANGDVNDPNDQRVNYALDWLNRRAYDSAADCLRALRQLCAQHEPDDPPMCFRDSDRGTVSSSLVALRSLLAESKYLHAQGPPCQTPYEDYSHLLAEISDHQSAKTKAGR